MVLASEYIIQVFMKNESTFLREMNYGLAFLCGTTATMPIVTFPSTNISLFTVFTIVFLLVNALSFVNDVHFKFRNNTHKLLMWLLASLLSSIFGLVYYNTNDEWSRAVQSYIPKIIVFIFIIFLVSRYSDLSELLLKGLLFGAVANVVVAIVDAITYYGLGYSLINRWFQNYIITNNIRMGLISLTISGTIRSGGFNYDPAHIGMLAPMIFLYGLVSGKYIYIVLAIGAISASLSTTAFVCCIACLLLYFTCVSKLYQRFRFTDKKLLLSFASLLICSYFLYQYASYIVIGFDNLFSRINDVHIHNRGYENIRLLYILYAPQAMIEQGIKMFTGTGFMTASEGFIKLGGDFGFPLKNYPFDMENTYLAYLFDFGFFGFYLYASYLFFTAKNLLKEFKFESNNQVMQIAFSGFFATIFSSFFYHYTLFACQILIFIAISVYMDKKIKKRKET